MDSNSVIYFLDGILPPKGMEFMRSIVDSRPQVSVMTEIEVLGFNIDAASRDIFDYFFEVTSVFDLSRPIVDQTISLRKTHKIKLPDAIIAATALVHGLTLITRDTGGFEKIAGLKTVDPHLM